MNQHFAQAKVTARKQIAVPKKVQDKLGGLEEGDYLLFYEENERIYIKRGKLVPETER
jgi:AbrB family looped-hinge helix DNA binding protein